ncbi:nicotinate-nucleotide--dimethylbenzimidazole phosphoribosyltransferase [Sphingomonas sp. FW199]|uniref:nicotinate-nucleotide--dimethylbenzimidazole phosphoribosyltransferase n=1 Tax=Sphingomonas sp. FW199 TaxID=3400217 RepID=UPI003CF4A44D
MIDAAAVREHLDALAKPQRSLGRLEDLAVRLAVVQQRLDPLTHPRRIVLFAGDHGVVAQGVTAWPQAVTGLMVETIRAGRATSSALAAAQRCDLRLVDVGVAMPPASPHPDFYHHASIAPGTADLGTGPAMTVDQFDAAWAVGAAEARRAHADGHAVLIAGEMGIGNTTPAACLTALLADAPPEQAVGRGAGADDAMLATKARVVADAVARASAQFPNDPRAAIASIAGFEIAAMAGFFAQGAVQGSTLLLDGYVATAGALIAETLAPGTRDAMIAAHRSAEPGHAAALARLGIEPLLDWQMRLGEGTGALVALPLIDSAAALLRDVALLSDLGV